jgi:hypothetical protein
MLTTVPASNECSQNVIHYCIETHPHVLLRVRYCPLNLRLGWCTYLLAPGLLVTPLYVLDHPPKSPFKTPSTTVTSTCQMHVCSHLVLLVHVKCMYAHIWFAHSGIQRNINHNAWLPCSWCSYYRDKKSMNLVSSTLTNTICNWLPG